MTHIAVHTSQAKNKCNVPSHTIVPYNVVKIRSVRDRYKGRYKLEPEIDLSNYKTTAVIDYIELEFSLSRETQKKHLQKTIAKFCKKSVSIRFNRDVTGNTSSEFKAKIQEADLREISKAIGAAKTKWGFAKEPTVTAIEISIDFYPHTADVKERKLMSAVLMRHLLPPHSMINTKESRPRSWGAKEAKLLEEYESRFSSKIALTHGYKNKPKSNFLTKMEESGKPLRIAATYTPETDATLYFGKRNSDAEMKIMDKVSDNENYKTGHREILVPNECRSRVEVTLRGAEMKRLEIDSFDGLCRFSFARLQGQYFRFATPTFVSQRQTNTNFKETYVNFIELQLKDIFLKTSTASIYLIEAELRRRRLMAIRERKTKGMLTKPSSLKLGPMGNMIILDQLNGRIRKALEGLSKRSPTIKAKE